MEPIYFLVLGILVWLTSLATIIVRIHEDACKKREKEILRSIRTELIPELSDSIADTLVESTTEMFDMIPGKLHAIHEEMDKE